MELPLPSALFACIHASCHAEREKGLVAIVEIHSCIKNKAPSMVHLMLHSNV